jgi:glycosyltransferase involved in cell wall biosynthesis
MRIVVVAERLRIAFITERFGRKFGGAEAYAVHLIDRLSLSHDVTVIAREFEHTLPITEVRINRLKGWPSWIRALHFAYRVRTLMRDVSPATPQYDVVHTHAMGPVGDIHVVHVVPIKFRRFFLQSRWRGFLSYLQPRLIAYLWLEAASVRSAPGRHVVAVSPSVESQLRVAYPGLKKVEMIPPGAHPKKIVREVREHIRTQLAWAPDEVGCLLVARNPLRKGLAAVAQALEILPQRYKLAVVGADDEARNYIQRHHPALSERVCLIEPVSDVSPYYQGADIYVHPTLRDSFGMAPLEAMAHGLPVILSGEQYCGFAAFVHHRHDAWVLENPRDSEMMTEAMLALDPEQSLRGHLIHHSAQLVEQFSWNRIAQRYESLYKRVLQERSQGQSQPRSR